MRSNHKQEKNSSRPSKSHSSALGWKIGFGCFFLLILFYACHPLLFKAPEVIDSSALVNDEPPANYISEIEQSNVSPYSDAEASLENNMPPSTADTSNVDTPPSNVDNTQITSADDIAYLIDALNTSEAEIPPLPEEDLATTEQHDTQSYQLYEEELPDNIIEDDLTSSATDDESSPYIHHNQKNIKDINIDIRHKPHYFGPLPVIAIVIDDMGVNVNRTHDIISLKAPLTSSFLTYGPKLQQQIAEAQASGHEIMAHVPMEPHKNLYTAPDGLTTAMSDAEIKDNFEKMLQKFPGIKGVNNHMGSKFTENRQKMSDIMEILHKHNLFFLDSKTTPKSVGKSTAAQYNVDYAHRHVFLDNNNDKAYILQQLKITERIAQKNGYAVAIGHPKSQTYNALKEWLPTVSDKGLKIVHMSDIVKVLN